jgi:hypothetical protein
VTAGTRRDEEESRRARQGKLLFSPEAPAAEWAEFEAAGFSMPVSGLVWDVDHSTCCGMALGGLGTGCLDIETSGVLGFSTIFNPPDEPRGRMPQLLLPFLGIGVNQTVWLLAAKKYIDGGRILGCTDPGVYPKDVPADHFIHWTRSIPRAEGVRAPRNVRYWGHFPVADLEYETDCPVAVSLRAWSPFIPGDMVDSNVPAAVFEVSLHNESREAHKCTLAFSFPGPSSLTEEEIKSLPPFPKNGYVPQYHNYGDFRASRVRRDKLRGVHMTSRSRKKVGYFLGVIGRESVRIGRGLASKPRAWSQISRELPPLEPGTWAHDSSTSVAVDCSLRAGQSKVVRFVLGWYSPHWRGASYAWVRHFDMDAARWSPDPKASLHKRERYVAAYALRYRNAVDAAAKMAKEHGSLLKRVLAWQGAVYTDGKLPVWLKDCLINSLNLIAEDGYWAQPRPALGEWAKPLGVFGMDESPRSCALIGCIASDWYGDLPVTYFFPELERTLIRAYAKNMRPDGAAVMLFPVGDFTIPTYE